MTVYLGSIIFRSLPSSSTAICWCLSVDKKFVMWFAKPMFSNRSTFRNSRSS